MTTKRENRVPTSRGFRATMGIFKTFSILILGLCLYSSLWSKSSGQTASLLPNAKQQFFDNNGNPLTSGTVTSYIPGTTTPKTTWQDAAETIPNANPLTLDSAGRALLLGSGSYRQIVKDRLNNIIWDQVTSSTGSGGGSGPTATGDGDLVGTIKPWAGITAPNQYALAYGQELSRTTFSALFTAITSTQAAFCTSGSPIITGIGDTTTFWIGMPVEIPCVGAGFSTIISKTSSTVTLAVNANTNLTTTAIFFPWGRGNGTTTFNLPDFRGLIPAGNNIMGGVASSNITAAFFGAADPNSSGGQGGGQSTTLVTGNLPAYTPTGTNAAITVTTTDQLAHGPNNGSSTGGGTQITTSLTGGAYGTLTSTGTAPAFTGIAQGGTSIAFSRIPPTKTVNYIIKTTPDVNSATASGVTSLGGMTGSIACGTGLLCTGNIISSNAASGTYINTGTGATATTIQSRLIQVKNIFDYGAKCDGATDDTTAIQNTINAAEAANLGNQQSGIAFAPAGYICKVSTGIIINSPVSVQFNASLTTAATTGTVITVNSVAPVNGNQSFDLYFASLTQSTGNVSTPSSVNGSGTTAIRVNSLAFSKLRLGAILGFTNVGLWLDGTGGVYAPQVIQHNDIYLGQIINNGYGVYANSTSAATSSTQANVISAQNIYQSFTDVRFDNSATDSNTLNIGSIDNANASGYGLQIFGQWNTFNVGYTAAPVRFEATSGNNTTTIGNTIATGVSVVDLGSANCNIIAGSDRAASLGACLQLDKIGIPAADVSFNNHKAAFVADPSALQDAATKNYVDTHIGSLTSFAVGDLVTASGAATFQKIADVATGNVILSGGVGAIPAYGKITSSHLNITATSCTNQAVISIASTGIGSCGQPYASGQIVGTATNDNATAGNFGEYKTATGGSTALTNNTTADLTSVSLSAGDWDCRSVVTFSPAGGTVSTVYNAWLNTTTATDPGAPNDGAYIFLQETFATGATEVFPVGTRRFSISGTTTVFVSAKALFSVSTLNAVGFVGCRRER